jgi:DHA2 family methylenomycin A resistance protein-like MFS transporter
VLPIFAGMENKHFSLTVLATSMAFVLVQLDVSIINVALATMGARLHTGVLGLQWVVDAYAVAFAALLLSAGGLGDRIGPRRMFMLGLATFTGASILWGVAPGAGSLIAARVLQGMGAAALVPSSLALLSVSCGDDAARRAWGVGMWTAAGSVGLAAGPLLGGVLVDLLGWRSIFLVNLPIGLFGLWLTQRFVASTRGAATRIDWTGQVLAIATLLCVTGSVIEAHRFGWSSMPIRGGLCAAILLAAGFIATEHRHAHPLLPLGFFRQRTFSGAIAVGFLLNLTLYGSLFVLGLYFQQIRHWPVWFSGIAFLPLPVVLGIANVLAHRVGAWLGAPGAMAAGLLVAACGTAALVGIGRDTASREILVGLVLIPAGIGVTVPVMTASLLGSVPRSAAGVASGALNAVRQAGGAIGVALFGGLSTHGAFLFGTGLLLTASVAAAGLIRSVKPAQHPAGARVGAQPISG